MALIPMPEWLPDQPAHQNPGLVICRNAIPRTRTSYGPFSGLSVYADALAARCQGAFAARDNAGNVDIFAGDASSLKLLHAASPQFEDVTRSVGGAYATPADEMWRFIQYGLNVIATNFADDVQSYAIGTSTRFAALSGGAPRAKYLAIWKDFVVLGHLHESPQRVRWSAIDDPTSFPTIGTSQAAQAQSDQQDLVGEGGWIQGIVGGLGGADGVVIQERALWRVTYVGPPLIFTFDLVEGARGTSAPGSIVQLGGVVAYLGEDGFYLFDGSSSRPIGNEKVDKTFFADFDQTFSARVSSAVDPINKIFYWAYPGSGNLGGVPNRILAYNWALDRWSLVELDGVELIFRAASFGYNADNADGLGYTADTSPFGPDSRFWAGGKSILSGFDAGHRLGFFSGAPLKATIETGDLDLAEGRRVMVSGVRVVADTNTAVAAVGFRDSQGAPPAYTPASDAAADGFCPQRVSTRFARARIEIPAGASWSHLSAFEARMTPEGTR
jgi:hypothetical protein